MELEIGKEYLMGRGKIRFRVTGFGTNSLGTELVYYDDITRKNVGKPDSWVKWIVERDAVPFDVKSH